MVPLRVVVCFALLAAAAATNVNQCPGMDIPNLSENVQLSPCTKPPCRLKKGTNQSITIKFTPDKDLNEVKNGVSADIGGGVVVPFLGVDGNSICDKVFTENGDKASCPLKSGTTYLYKDSFPIYAIYPPIKVKVHWELKDDHGDITCFEVPARIV
ncbi:unnamed protein product [Spodoptera littoralis]|uniref:MD-2-related lipid-recognition domain-containing protein n=1 Tax=Spodoptera littoralis TaxID=7109 RepID=A0A9P0I1H5_SPOLI|nr:unnamed protein product [Spodoptera littoralis]CAH1637771.1 unnamed protein product [Spodoptera littoralis]